MYNRTPGYFIPQGQDSCEKTIVIAIYPLQVQALERNPELEIKILDDLVEFSTEQCLILPAPQPEAKDDVTSSSASLNVVVCKNEENTSALWEKICKTISWALLLNIDKLTLTQNKEQASEVFMKRVSLLEKMLILYLLFPFREGREANEEMITYL